MVEDLQGLLNQVAVVPVCETPVEIQLGPVVGEALGPFKGLAEAIDTVDLVLCLVHLEIGKGVVA